MTKEELARALCAVDGFNYEEPEIRREYYLLSTVVLNQHRKLVSQRQRGA